MHRRLADELREARRERRARHGDLGSPDEYDGWKETIAIHGEAVLMRDIKAGRAALKATRAKVYTLEELLKSSG